MSLSARLDFRASRMNAVNFEENYLIGFIIITHNYLITTKLRVCNWDSVSNDTMGPASENYMYGIVGKHVTERS